MAIIYVLFRRDIMRKYKLDEIQKYEPRYKSIIGTKRPFGVEIEVGSMKKDTSVLSSFRENIADGTGLMFPSRNLYKTSWQYVRDCSINDSENPFKEVIGYEFVSPILNDTKETWLSLKEICTEIRDMNYFITDKCAAHVHIDASSIRKKPNALINLYKIWMAYEDVIFNFGYFGMNPRRCIGKFSVPLCTNISNTMELLDLAKDKSYKVVLDYLYLARHSAINIMNIRDEIVMSTGKNTIEFRCANGTLNPFYWQQLVKLYQTLFEYSMGDNFDEEYMDALISKQSEDIINMPLDLDKACELADLIYSDEEDKMDFLHIYTKKLRK